ncbi:MAG: ATP-binding protein [Thermodesulfovibrionales bacterium]
MPFNSIPAKDFVNRGSELTYLRRLPEMKSDGLAGNVILEGARGIGKTELLKQLYRILFMEEGVVPFYYSFRTANLKGNYFARDYLTRFVRQYLAFLRKDPFLAENVSEPLEKLIPLISSLGLEWLLDCMADFQVHLNNKDLYWQIVAAISAPVTAARKGGSPVFVMLDDFDAAENLYESVRGDAHGLTSLFSESMKNSLCPHVITGSAAALEAIFADQALVGGVERLRLGALPDDLARTLFRSHLEKLQLSCVEGETLKFLNVVRGNPLYIRNLATTARKMQKNNLTEKDLVECYSMEVSEGETALYWSSVFSRYAGDAAQRKAVIQLLMHALENRGMGSERLSKVLGLRESETGAALDELQASGMLRDKDPLLQDFLRGLFMKEIEGRTTDQVREAIEKKYLREKEESCFELVIPMDSNAELVAAGAVEQIGKNLGLDSDFLSFLQLALIEVCINAIEHSGSYDRRILLKFISRPDDIEITIESAGRPFTLDSLQDIPADEKLRGGQKRGWGFRLISGIMDNVKVERVGDRTRVVLKKNIKRKEVLQ